MTPLKPILMDAVTRLSSPDNKRKSFGQRLANSMAFSMLLASLIPMMLGCFANSKTVGICKCVTVRPGTLYNKTGTGEASAMAVKCAISPA